MLCGSRKLAAAALGRACICDLHLAAATAAMVHRSYWSKGQSPPGGKRSPPDPPPVRPPPSPEVSPAIGDVRWTPAVNTEEWLSPRPADAPAAAGQAATIGLRRLPRPRRIVLLRHGESQFNRAAEASARLPEWKVPLTPRGVLQVQRSGPCREKKTHP